ncbi:STAS domain-containing protein [Actinomadura latina]|uniref:Anti-sigma factor antagonist n=1 Tax=Actinomadura latina TaxID=163603 RepID=A0A846YUN8_9ACTN|nr:STAS domain-containing protein [Actinomadura latina]NKZ02342.1 STAS domain-containing protein [Actinomadura latina]
MPTDTPSSPEAGLTRECLADHTVIAIRGELDSASTPSMRERLHVALQDTGAQVIIDLSGVTFCDTSGLAMLVGARRRREAKSATVILAAPRPQPARLLEVTGLLRAFTVRSSVTEARTAGPGPRSAAA